MDNIKIGLEFIDNMDKNLKVLKYNEKYKKYECCQDNQMNGLYPLLSKDDILFLLTKQDKYKQQRIKNIEYKIEQQEKEDRQKQEYENVYGFCDTKTPLQKGKILKILNTMMNYTTYGVMKRKDWLLLKRKDNCKIDIRYNVKTITRNGAKNIPIEYIVYVKNNDNEYTTITKTEYEYIEYLYRVL
jgi:hypothetical protein